VDERTGVDRRAFVRWDSGVPKYDAFGREVGENTLAGLGGDSNEARTPHAEPAPADGWTEPAERAEPATRTRPERPQATPSARERAPVTVSPGAPKRRSKGLGCLVALVIAGAIAAGPVIGIIAFVDSATDSIDDVTESLDPDVLEQIEPPDAPESGPPPTGIGGRSLIAERNFGRALSALEQTLFTRATRIDLRPDRLTVTAVSNDSEVDVRIGYDGAVSRGDISPLNDAFGTLALADVDPAAPARLVRGAARRYRVKPAGIDYVLAGPEPDGHHWRAYFKNGVYVEGNAKGRVIRRFDGG
jgi:hypothetical protein